MTDKSVPTIRYAPGIALPCYSYVPGHGSPHPVNEPVSERRSLAATLIDNAEWLHALDLFNHGFYWEAHEVWEGFWNTLGRTTPEARLVQGLIHLAAAAVKIREGKPHGVARHARRARELLGGTSVADSDAATLGLTPASMTAVLGELESLKPACWHTTRAAVVSVLDARLELAV